ncbi:hypothetical protein TrLO_g11401 [Triparma laevis f. longispina]|uniref:MYND-type domain-containing protein n=1 Tax=Triparma laevis f. longispina TaxID=1714387 RepID=A0A9W7F647_9STRA|nr:hypothetical protein TrLO_g11401 [Triparma laevis f. longispina]
MSEEPKPRCSECNKIPYGGKLKGCSACKMVSYCDAECQKAHWPVHRKDCKKMKAKRLKDSALSKGEEIANKQDGRSGGNKGADDQAKIVINNERLIITRTPPLDDKWCYSQFMPKDAYGAYINATKPPCWCNGVGQNQSLLVAFAFNPTLLAAKESYVQSQYLTAFGVNFQIVVTKVLNNLSVDLAEEPTNKNIEDYKGINARCSYWFCGGKTGDVLTIPPPSKGKFRHAGVQKCNSHMAVWSGVGCKRAMGLHEMKALPTVTKEALEGGIFVQEVELEAELPKVAYCVCVMIEKVGDVGTLDEFEQSSIQSHLHTYHADSVPKEEVPQFCKNACRIGLKKLNMDQPVSIVNVMPNEQAPASGGGKSAVPAGMENLSPEGLAKLQEIMEGIQNERPDMAGIEKALGDLEVGPVLKTILASPQVAPLFARMVQGMAGAGTR